MSDLFDQSPLIDLAQRLVAAARAAGADAADAVALRSMSLAVELREGAVEESERSESDDVGLRVLVGQKQALVSTNDIGAADVRTLAERAVAMARVAPEDRYAGLADARLLARDWPDLDLVDRDLPSVSALESLARDAEKAALAVKGVSKSGGASASAGIGGMVLVTSHGFCGTTFTSRHGLSMTAIAGEGTGMERDYEYSTALHRADLWRAEDVGRAAGERAVRRLQPRKVPTQRLPVIFDPRLAGSLVGHLAGAVNGAAIARKTSFLQDKMGERLFENAIQIIDDPLRARGLASRPFDAEGVAVASRAIVQDGILQTWFLDSATGRELGLPTTGHARRGVSSPPSPGPTNLHLEAGTLTPAALIAETRQGLYVTDLIGSGVNLTTGDYSRGVAGFWIENGELSYPVSEVTIAGHLTDMFRTLTPANDLQFRFGVNAPTTRVEGLTIAGQ